jgi:hypothetical protein
VQVYKGYLEGVQEVAIKVFAEQGSDHRLIARKKLLKEVALLKSCRSPSIVQVRLRLQYVRSLVLHFAAICVQLMSLAERFPNGYYPREGTLQSQHVPLPCYLLRQSLFLVVQLGARR